MQTLQTLQGAGICVASAAQGPLLRTRDARLLEKASGEAQAKRSATLQGCTETSVEVLLEEASYARLKASGESSEIGFLARSSVPPAKSKLRSCVVQAARLGEAS